ncbi:MAG: NAD(P)/FAD-dependent oxidoreductase [bacterium]
MSRSVIIGGGIIGLCCAYALRRGGEEVVVLERDEPGAGASSHNAGLIVPSFSGPLPGPGGLGATLRSMLRPDSPFYLNPRALPETAGWLRGFWRHCNAAAYEAGFAAMARLGAGTMSLFDDLAADGVRFDMYREGLLFAFLQEAHMAHLLEDFERLRPYGYGRPKILSGAEVRDLEPALSDQVRSGFFLAQERHVQPETLISGLLARLRQLGAEVRPHSAVTDIERRSGTVTAVATPAGRVEGDRFLIAAGAWSGQVARMCGVPLPIQGIKGYSLSVDAPRRFHRPIYLGDARLIAGSFRASTRVAGWLEISGIHPSVDAGRIAAMRRAAQAFLREWDVEELGRRRAGLRPMAPDGLPVIGAVPGYDNLFVAAGHGVLGITLAPATARAIAAIMRRADPEPDLHPFSPVRFLLRT